MFWKLFKKEKRKPQLPNSVLMPLVIDTDAQESVSGNTQAERHTQLHYKPDFSAKPKKIRLVTDEYHLQNLGKLGDGTFFLVSSQLYYDHAVKHTTDYLCRFDFDADGNLIENKIIKLGVRGEFNHEDGVKEHLKLMPEKDSYGPADVSIKPFSIEFDGLNFGFIPRVPEDKEDVWAVEFMPGNTMAFFEPWDRGDYDT